MSVAPLVRDHNQPLAEDSVLDPPTNPPIDLAALLQAKNPILYRRFQGWPLAAIRWLAREQYMNQRLMDMPAMSPREFPGWALDQIGISTRFPNAEQLPAASERPVFLANHPTGGLDGLVLLHGLLSIYSSVRVVVTDLLLTIPHLRPLTVPVDRYQSSRQSVRNLHAAFAGDAALLIFPAGRTARRQQGRLTDFPWHSMPITLSQRHQRPLVPLHLEADNSWRFHALSWWRRRFGIGLNLEMSLLVRELLNPATSEYQVWADSALSPGQVKAAGADDNARLNWVRAQYDALAADAQAGNGDDHASSH